MLSRSMVRALAANAGRRGGKIVSRSHREEYLKRLANRPKWAERHMRRLAGGGELPTRCLDGRYWMCLRAGFKPMRDLHWDWWCGLSWMDQNWFYEQGMLWWRMGRVLRKKHDPMPKLKRLAFESAPCLQ